MTEPYLSVVATARNDDHGGNPLYRMQLFVDGLLAQCERHRLPAELVLVEWNPPADRPRLEDVLTWPEREGYCRVRIVEVPHTLHSTLEHADRLPLYQMIGKNVGIRRAHGEFVLATNIDILFSDELMSLIAARTLDPNRVYRVDRVDVPAEIDPAWSTDEQLAFCRSRSIRVNYYDATVDVASGKRYRIYRDVPFVLRWLPQSWLARTIILRYLLWRAYAFGYWIVAGFNDPRQVPARAKRRLRRLLAVTSGDPVAADAAVSAAVAPRSLLKVPRLAAQMFRLAVATGRRRGSGFLKSVEWEKARIRLHTNASGDFTLMAKDAWARVGGYAEFEMYSMHIDGLVLYQAHYAGIRERRLKAPVYHIEHGGGFRPGAKDLAERLERAAIPQISNDQLMAWIYDMYKTKKPIQFNDADWGFATEDLPETSPFREPAAEPAQTEVA